LRKYSVKSQKVFAIHNKLLTLNCVSIRESSDLEQDKAEWEQDISDELEEMQEQADEEYQKKMEKYTQDLKLWKEQKQRKVCVGIRKMA